MYNYLVKMYVTLFYLKHFRNKFKYTEDKTKTILIYGIHDYNFSVIPRNVVLIKNFNTYLTIMIHTSNSTHEFRLMPMII